MPRRILIAPDKFKGTLSGHQAARAIETGVRRAALELGASFETTVQPLADGGEGTLDIVLRALNAQRLIAHVTGPHGGTLPAAWGIFSDGDGATTALIESAQACGIAGTTLRDPSRATTAGVGELVRLAADHGVRRVVVSLGGSATVDAGVGMLSSLGWRFLDDGGVRIAAPTGADLERIGGILPMPLAGVELIGWCDVDSPLLGDAGAAPMFAPQKGATPAQVASLAHGLERFADAARAINPGLDPMTPGAGAAGGLGYAIMLLGGSLTGGCRAVMRTVGFDDLLREHGLVITGEGRLDASSLRGKVVFEVARAAQESARNAFAVVGSLGNEPGALLASFAGAGAPLRAIESAAAFTGPQHQPVPTPEEAAARLVEAARRVMLALPPD